MASNLYQVDNMHNHPDNDSLQEPADTAGSASRTYDSVGGEFPSGALANSNGFEFDFPQPQNTSNSFTDPFSQSSLSQNFESTGLFSDFWSPNQLARPLHNQAGQNFVNAGQPLVLETPVSRSLGTSSEYLSSFAPGINQYLTPESTVTLSNNYLDPWSPSVFVAPSYLKPGMMQTYSSTLTQLSPLSSNQPLENPSLCDSPKTGPLFEYSEELNHRKRKRILPTSEEENPGRSAKFRKTLASVQPPLTPFPEKAVADLFNVWQSTQPQGAVPSEVVVHGFAMITGLPYQKIHDWYFKTQQHSLPVQIVAPEDSTISASLVTHNDREVLRRAATRLPVRRDQCLQRISPEQRTANRTKAWDPHKMFSCTSCCGFTFKKKCDWDRHEKLNRPQRAWLCNHGAVWNNQCSFCSERRPGPNHIELAHKGRKLCCDKNLGLGSGKNNRIFLRKSHLKQHFDNTHPNIPFDEFGEQWSFPTLKAFHERCGFCGTRLMDWDSRSNHVGGHFKDDKMGMNQWKDPWEGPSLAARSNAEDQDDNIDSDGQDGDDDEGDGDDSSDDGHDRRGPSSRDNNRKFGSPDKNNPPPPRHSDTSRQSHGRWSTHGLVSKLMLQLGLYFRSILGESSTTKSKLPSFLNFTDLANVIRHESLHDTSPLSLAADEYEAPQEANSNVLRVNTPHKNSSLSASLPLPTKEDLVLTFWLRPLSRDFSFEALSSKNIRRRGLLGTGSSSCVDEIRIPNHNQVVARKSCRDPSLVQRLNILQELSLLSRVDHHHVVRGLGIMLESGSASLLMTPVADYTLRDLLKVKKISPSHTMALKQSLGCLASALGAIHHQGIRHGDLKPDNILVLNESYGHYRMLISDFGLSTFSSNFSPRSRNRGLTPLYAAPELYTDVSPDRAADVYSMGLIFLEMVTVLAGRTIDELHDFIFANQSNEREIVYWRRSNRMHNALSLYCQNIEQKSIADTEWLDFGQLTTLMSMLHLSVPKRPQASEVMRQFPQGSCCGKRTVPSFSRRCATCGQLEVDNDLSSFVVSYSALNQSATLEGCNVCSLLLQSLITILEDELLFSGQLTWKADHWLFISAKDHSETLLEFFTLPYQTPELAIPGTRKRLLTAGDTSSEPCLELARQWLDECVSNHKFCTSTSAPRLPDRVLHLRDEQVYLLETDGMHGDYATLSYCWGSSISPVVKTTEATLSAHKVEIPWPKLPRTFQDAIAVTQKFGLKYLWIDSFCIIQDSQQDREHQCSKMADIYSQAHINISADSSKSSSCGMFSVDKSGHLAKEIKPYKIHARQRIPHASCSINGSNEDLPDIFPLNSRAWVFQERMLSPRIIHFTTHEISWECKELDACECALLQDTSSPKRRHSKHAPMTTWHDIVSRYSSLTLTYESDKLPAISGLAKATQRLNGDEYLAGLWRTTIQNDLLWFCSAPTSARPCQYQAPSWSWASITGSIKFETKGLVSLLHIGEVQCLPNGVDETGGVKFGSLTLSGRILSATLLYCSGRKSELSRYELVFSGLKRQGFRADYVLSDRGTHFIPSSTPVSVLIAAEIDTCATLVCLVLRKLSSGEFERLGFVALDDYMKSATAFGIMKTITIV